MKSFKYEVFTSFIEKHINEGIYMPGHKLPSVREVKDKYQISISTVQSGYEYLMIRGLVISIPKSGYFVATATEKKQEKISSRRKPVVRDPLFKNNLLLTTSLRSGRQLSEFNVAAPGDLLVPQKLLLRTMQQVIREEGTSLLRYYPANGSSDLRNTISGYAAGYQTVLPPEELLITDGALQSLYIALSSVCTAGDVIALESPCVFSVLEIIRVLHLKVIEIPADTQSGFDVDFFRKACEKNNIKAVLLTPNFHNPTGILLSDEKKKDLLRIIQHEGIALIENDIYGDLSFTNKRPLPVKAFDESGLVMTYSSYSKTLAPGIRLGWLSAGRFMERAEQIRFSLGSSVSPVYQETVNRLLKTNSYDRHLRHFRKELAKNANLTVRLLSENFPKDTTLLTPSGGYNLWVRMPDQINMESFYQQCNKIGVRFTPGYTFSFSGIFSNYFRIVFSDSYTTQRIEALRLAGQLAG
ncbi:PLP-dependent aminotransferase family protein [Sphingobacterium spiritivorum]|uniref:aminotransferase-like domain-containing protein n=1 Tax=Sphingobacterium spiritivorum TaxID=258 RepID=UPI003DA27E3D